MKVPFIDLRRQYYSIKKELDTEIDSVLDSGNYILGPQVTAFEHEFAQYIGGKYCVSVASGTDALTLGIKSLGIGKGDEVIVPANSYPTAFGVALTGTRLLLIDVGKDGNIATNLIPGVVTKKTKAIVAVHLYGNPADLTSIFRHSQGKRQKVYVIEDAAQAHGAKLKISCMKNKKSVWRRVGSIGDIGCFSFYPTKNLGAYADAGMIVTDKKPTMFKIKSLRMYGEETRYHSKEVSGVSRLDDLQAAILRLKLRYLDDWNKRRGTIVRRYLRELAGVGDLGFLSYDFRNLDIMESPIAIPSYQLFVIRSKYRDKLMAFLGKKGIASGVYYPIPVHLQGAFRHLGYKNGDFPVAEALSKEILSLPLFPELTNDEIEYICKSVKLFFKKL